MKEIDFKQKDVADATWNWMQVNLPAGFLQYVNTVYSNPLSANGHYVIVAFAKFDDSEEKPADDPVVSDGHIIFRHIQYLKLATSGMLLFNTEIPVKMYNLEIPEPTRFWMGFKHNRGGTMSYRFSFLMSDEKLLEVV